MAFLSLCASRRSCGLPPIAIPHYVATPAPVWPFCQICNHRPRESHPLTRLRVLPRPFFPLATRTRTQEPELLILDEPTNHLSVQGVEWLEQRLADPSLTVLMVSHDRAFIDSVCNEILELDGSGGAFRHMCACRGTMMWCSPCLGACSACVPPACVPSQANGSPRQALHSRSGNYTRFLDAREERYKAQEALAANASTILRKEAVRMPAEDARRSSTGAGHRRACVSGR